MISFFQIFNRGGAVLWSRQLEVVDSDTAATHTTEGEVKAAAAPPRIVGSESNGLPANPHRARIDALVQNVLLEDRSGQSTFQQQHYALKVSPIVQSDPIHDGSD